MMIGGVNPPRRRGKTASLPATSQGADMKISLLTLSLLAACGSVHAASLCDDHRMSATSPIASHRRWR